MKKKSVLFYLDNYTPAIKSLSYEQKGMLFDAIISYAGGIAEEPKDMGLLSLALDPIKAAIDRDNEKYKKVCERNRKNGLKGGKPKQTQTNPVGSSGLESVPSETQRNPNKPDNDSDTDTDTDTDTDIKQPLSTKVDEEGESFYLTAKKKKLTGKRLEAFEEFWDAFGYKQGKSSAADSWLAIPKLDRSIMDQILTAARIEASNRDGLIAKGRTPKMAQGWLTERRWEDEMNQDKPKMSITEQMRAM